MARVLNIFSASRDIDPEAAPADRYVVKRSIGSSHSWAIDQIQSASPTGKALDVGPGSGVMAKELRAAGAQEVHAVEIDERAREALRGSYDSLSESLSAYSDYRFSMILCLDVLEHMADPFAFYQEACRLLEPGGSVLISLPNVAHWSVRIPLLFGCFNYEERAILDKTHLQFFTRKRAVELAHSVPQMKIVGQSVTIEPVELLFPEWFSQNVAFRAAAQLRLGIARTFPGLMAFQNLLHVQKIKADS